MLFNLIIIVFITSILWFILFLLYIKKQKRENEVKENIINKHLDSFLLYNQWLMMRNEGKRLANYFEEMGYQNIAVYGLGDIANRLAEELEGSDIRIEYGVDQNLSNVKTIIETTYSMQEELPKVDVVVVTPFHTYGSIEKVLKKKVDCPIISIEDVVWSV